MTLPAPSRPHPLQAPGAGVDPLDAAAAAWLLSFDSPHTRAAYARDLRRWFGHCVTLRVHPFEARRVHLDTWARTGAGYARTPKPASLARTLAAVSSFYAYCVMEELTDRNPVDAVRRPQLDRDDSPTRGLTADEAKELLTAATERLTLRDQVAIRLMLVSGLREGAVLDADVDGLGWDAGHRVLRVRWKGGSTRNTVLPPATSHALDAYLAARGNPTEGPLLVTSTGARVAASHLFRAVRRAARWALLEDPDTVTPHSLRHTFATLALDRGADLHVVQDAMGHADPRQTRRYDRARSGRLAKHPAYLLAGDLES